MKNWNLDKAFMHNRQKSIERKKRSKKINVKSNNLIIKGLSTVLPKNYYKSNIHLKRARKQKPKDLYAPNKLTLQLGYSEEVLKFINSLKKYGQNFEHINLRLDDVTSIGEGAIAMLLSVINELTKDKILITGTKPKDITARNVLERSGFFKYMRGNVSLANMNTKNIMIRTGDINTSQNELYPEIPKAMETVWGVSGRCPELFGVIGEMLRNSNDHAFKNGNKIIWHLGLSHHDEINTVKFSFVDNGVGIIKSYNTRSNWQKIISIFKNNALLLESAFKKGIESKTGLPWRGEGLPTIFDLYNDNIITNLVVITNNVYLNFDDNEFQEINIPFSGTYYFWKINKDCKPSYFP